VIAAWQRLLRNTQMLRKGEMTREAYEHSLRSWIAHAEHGDTWGLRSAMVERIATGRRTGRSVV
jgi:hypothetical protein